MSKKSRKSYEHLFNYINSEILPLNGATFITDYEMGLRNALKTVFPTSKLFGCWFHYCQSVRRQITTKYKDLAAHLRSNRKASLEYHKLLSLPLLPASHISGSFDMIKNQIEQFDHHFKFNSFLVYFENQWLKKVNH